MALTLVFTHSAAEADGWKLTVRTARPGVLDSPILVAVNPSLHIGDYVLELPGAPAPIIAQVFGEAGRHWLGSVLPSVPAQGTYRLRPRTSSDKVIPEGFVLEPRGANIAILLDQNLVSEYRTDIGAKPFLFPLVGPTGNSYTRAYPLETLAGEDRDHPHQRSLWFTHGKVNGIDFWSEQKGHGTIKETARTSIVSGSVLGRLSTSDDWIGPDGRKVCEDERVLTFYKTANARVIDFEIVLKAAPGPVTFGDTKEGMFGLRVASSMDVDRKRGGRIVNAEGLVDGQAWGKPSPWVDYSGPINGKTVGIAILNHPRSFRYPTTWHVRTYGLFAANPFGWHDFGLSKPGDYTLPAGGRLWFGYRVILHEGDATLARIADAFERYGEPPTIEVTAG
ncbi:MAG: PmoA family protein [Isosphaeraceae bacterium]